MGVPEKALESYSRALTVDPAFTGSRIGRAWSLASLGRYDDAILEGLGPPQYLLANWTSARALVLSRVGRYREALQAIETGSRAPGISENAAERGIQFLVLSFLAIERGSTNARCRTPARPNARWRVCPRRKRGSASCWFT